VRSGEYVSESRNTAKNNVSTRHARRLYIGGIPPSYSVESELRDFLSTVIAKGLGEENTNAYIVSMYLNQKNCFCFVELQSIELTTACLDLDGILYKKTVLKVLRANEYRPELVPVHLQQKVISLDLSSFVFANRPAEHSIPELFKQETNEYVRSVGSLISPPDKLPCNIFSDDVALVSFSVPPVLRWQNDGAVLSDCTNFPASFRAALEKSKHVMSMNHEFGVDISRVTCHDLGDVVAEADYASLTDLLGELIAKIIVAKGIPFIFGGSSSKILRLADILHDRVGSSLCVVRVDASIAAGHPAEVTKQQECHSASSRIKYVHYAAQVRTP
jgi:hypothetical protein